MYYVPKESQIKTERTKLLLKHGRTCGSCEYLDYNCKESLAYDFYGFSKKCTLNDRRGVEVPETRTCNSWTLAEIDVTPILAEREIGCLRDKTES